MRDHILTALDGRVETTLDSDPLLRELLATRHELGKAREREAELLAQLVTLRSDSDASRAAGRAALNLMEDAIAARRAERVEYAQRLRSELAFRESEAHYQALFESMTQGCCIVELYSSDPDEPPDYRIVKANSAFLAYADATEVIGKPIRQVLPYDGQDLLVACNEVAETGQTAHFEHVLSAAQRAFEISIFKIKVQPRKRFAVLWTDITERKRSAVAEQVAAVANERLARVESELELVKVKREAEEAVRANEERFRAFMDQNPTAAFIKDEQGRYVFVNRMLEQRFGRPLKDWIGKTDFDLFDHDEAVSYREHDLEILRSQRVLQFDESALEEDGLHEWLSFKFPMRDLAGNWFIAGTALDVTKQRQTEAALAVNQKRLRELAGELARAEFQERLRIASVLHEDVQQLLIATQLRMGTLESRVADCNHQKQFEVLNQLVSETIEKVRSLSRDLVPPTLYQLGLRAALDWLAERYQQRYGLHVAVSNAGDIDPLSELMRDMLYHIAQELLLNVVKHAHTDSADLELSKNGDFVQLVVRDRGVGFDPPENSPLQNSWGLFQIRERVLLVGGSFELRTAAGRGTEAIVSVPPDAMADLPANQVRRTLL